MVEQRLALPRVTRPTEPFDPSTGLPALAPVVKNDCMLGRECIALRLMPVQALALRHLSMVASKPPGAHMRIGVPCREFRNRCQFRR